MPVVANAVQEQHWFAGSPDVVGDPALIGHGRILAECTSHRQTCRQANEPVDAVEHGI